MAYALENAWRRARERLALLEQGYDPTTTRLLGALGVGEGWRCWEVGAGGGSIARWLCEQVGEQVGERGHVLATDLDPRFLDTSDQPNLAVQRHDVVADPLPAEPFDLVHARLVLMHLPARERVLERLVATLKPGG